MDKIADREIGLEVSGAELPKAIQCLRKSLGLTQAALAKKLMVKPNTVWRYEKGTIKPTPQILFILATLAKSHGTDTSFPPSEEDAVSLAIASIRRRMNLDRATFGKAIGADRTTVAKYEAGRAKPSAQDLIKILSFTQNSSERG